MKFHFKMTGKDNNLSVFFKTFSGETTLHWSLHGNHGTKWENYGAITYQPVEKFQVRSYLLVCSLSVDHDNNLLIEQISYQLFLAINSMELIPDEGPSLWAFARNVEILFIA